MVGYWGEAIFNHQDGPHQDGPRKHPHNGNRRLRLTAHSLLFPTRRGEEGLPSAVIILILLFCVGLILFLPAGTRKYGKQLMISMVIGVFVWVGILVASGSAKL